MRNLEREIGNLCRKVARKVVEAQSPVSETPSRTAETLEVIEEEAAPSRRSDGRKKSKKKAKKEEPALDSDRKGSHDARNGGNMLGPAKFRRHRSRQTERDWGYHRA